MRAIVVEDGRLRWGEQPTPVPGPGELRIRVVATAVNRADLLQVAGAYSPPPGASPILGLECAGVIDALGADVEGWRVGDEVCALLAGGGYAERVVCPAVQVAPRPDGVSLVESAALPEVFATAWSTLIAEAGLQPGERVLVHAGASGVGTAAIQLCGLVGAPVWVTVGSAEKLAACVALGAQGGQDRHAGPWIEAPWARDGVDVVLDPVGGAYLPDHLEVLRAGGRLIVIGLMGGRRADIDLGRLLRKRLRVVGSVLRHRTPAAKGDIVRGIRRDLWPAFGTGRLHPVVHERLPVTRADDAHALVASDRTIGKVLLTLPH